MRKFVAVAAVSVVVLSLSACGKSGYDRARPDEFAVARQPNLVIPPDFALVPPTPGAARTGVDPSRQGLEALFGTAPRSAVEQATIQQAGGESAEAGIRSQAGDPDTNVVNKGQTTRDIVAAPEGDGQEARANAGGPTTAPAAQTAPAPTPAPQPQ